MHDHFIKATLGPFGINDTNVTCLVSNLFSYAQVSAAVTVNPDTAKPTAISAASDDTLCRVYLRFSERLDPISATDTNNYEIFGLEVLGAFYNPSFVDGTNQWVVLTTSPQLPGQMYKVILSGVRDGSAAGNEIDPVGVIFTSWAMVPQLTRSGSNMTLSWPKSAWTLQRTPVLANPFSNTVWTDVTGPYTDGGTNRSIVLPASGSAQFFRLRQ